MLIYVQMGVESGSDKILKDISRVRNAVRSTDAKYESTWQKEKSILWIFNKLHDFWMENFGGTYNCIISIVIIFGSFKV